jgi:hypothetical protein
MLIKLLEQKPFVTFSKLNNIGMHFQFYTTYIQVWLWIGIISSYNIE